MTCRSTSTTLSLSCSGGNNGGAQLGYDNEGRLIGWQNAPSRPTTTVVDAYDGEGHRVVQKVTSGGTTTTTDYLGAGAGLAEQVVGGALTSYYAVAGVVTAVSVGGTLSYLATDGLGSVTAALSSASAVLAASQLFGPYGSVRYQSGVMPTAKGFTGQYADAATGPDYYDALAGQFISADSVLPGDGMDVWGLSRYAYVEGNPETGTDPSGHRVCMSASCDRGGGSRDDGSGGYDPSLGVADLGIVTAVEKERILLKLKSLNRKTQFVRRYTTRSGVTRGPYPRRPPTNLGKIRFFEKYGGLVEGFGWVLTAVGFVLDAKSTADSYYQARPDQGMGQAVAMGIAHAAYATGGALIGAFALSWIPVVGPIVGAAAGAWVGNWIGDQFVQANELPNNGYSGPADQYIPAPVPGL